MYDKAKLAKILAACEKATPGPWEWEPHQEGMDHFTGPWYEPASIRIGDNYFVAFSLDADAQFIALARTALPTLARDYGALLERNETLETILRDVYDWLTKNKLQYSGHGRLIESILAEGGGE